LQKKYEAFVKKQTSLEGVIASPGRVIGKARVINDLAEQEKCKPNEIIVIAQTRPQYNQYLSKVLGIITAEGGALCHAAILAREHKIPCIVGTKYATKKFKTGDTISLDADKGVIKQIK
jgi:pyruvate,water dikinase